MQRRQLTATGHRPVSRPRRLKRLLAQDNRDGVDRWVHRLDPPQMGLDDGRASSV